MSQKPRRASTGTVNLARSLIEVCRGTSSQSTEDADCTLDKVLWDVFSEHEDILDMLTTAGLSCSAEVCFCGIATAHPADPMLFKILKWQLHTPAVTSPPSLYFDRARFLLLCLQDLQDFRTELNASHPVCHYVAYLSACSRKNLAEPLLSVDSRQAAFGRDCETRFMRL